MFDLIRSMLKTNPEEVKARQLDRHIRSLINHKVTVDHDVKISVHGSLHTSLGTSIAYLASRQALHYFRAENLIDADYSISEMSRLAREADQILKYSETNIRALLEDQKPVGPTGQTLTFEELSQILLGKMDWPIFTIEEMTLKAGEEFTFERDEYHAKFGHPFCLTKKGRVYDVRIDGRNMGWILKLRKV